MKRYIFSIAVLMLLAAPVIAQISLQPVVPTVGLIQQSQLWNVMIINGSASSYNCRLNLTLQDRATGQPLLTAHTGEFIVGPGGKQQNINSLAPIEYNYISAGINTRTGLIPVGSYTACYTISSGEKAMDLAEECIQFDVEPLSPPLLTFPSDSSQLESSPTQFTWMPPTPGGMFDRLQYDVIITQINDGQKPEEAMQQNLPFYSNGNVISNLLSYTGSGSDFEKDKWYAWQVIARDDKNYSGKSETWVFKVKNPSITKLIIEQSPYLKMKKNSPSKGIAVNGILKLSYVNETTDSVAQINVIELNGSGKNKMQISVPVQPGENLFQYDLTKKFQLEEGKIYQAEIINSRKEKWMIQFECHNYKGKESGN